MIIESDVMLDCNFVVEEVNNDVVHLAWDASKVVNRDYEMYDPMIKSYYSKYLRSKGRVGHTTLYNLLKPQPETFDNGIGFITIFKTDLDIVKEDIIDIIKKFLLSKDELTIILKSFIKDDKALIPVTKIAVLGDEIFCDTEGFKVKNDFFHVEIDAVNGMYAVVTYDFTNLKKLHKRLKPLATRLELLYKSYKETQETDISVDDPDTVLYIRIEDLEMFIVGVDRIIQDEIKMEYF